MVFDTELRNPMGPHLAAHVGRDAAACAELYAVEGDIHSPFGLPALGRAAIRATHQDWFSEDKTNKTLGTLSSIHHGRLAYALLRCSAETRNGPEAGTSLNIFEIADSGRWQFCVTSLNADFETPEPARDTT